MMTSHPSPRAVFHWRVGQAFTVSGIRPFAGVGQTPPTPASDDWRVPYDTVRVLTLPFHSWGARDAESLITTVVGFKLLSSVDERFVPLPSLHHRAARRRCRPSRERVTVDRARSSRDAPPRRPSLGQPPRSSLRASGLSPVTA